MFFSNDNEPEADVVSISAFLQDFLSDMKSLEPLGVIIPGGPGSDTLVGGYFTNDTLVGMGGDDTYILYSQFSIIVEGVNEGIDTVQTIIDLTLPANVENLVLLATAKAGYATSGMGNTSANSIYGNFVMNSIYGEGGSDTLYGADGDDTLGGGQGNDFFVFSTALGPKNVDTINDFRAKSDTISLDNSIFSSLKAEGALNPKAFYIGSGAHDASDRIIYNPANGALFYDPNGNGAGGAQWFATLLNAPTITIEDFLVI